MGGHVQVAAQAIGALNNICTDPVAGKLALEVLRRIETTAKNQQVGEDFWGQVSLELSVKSGSVHNTKVTVTQSFQATD